MRLDRIIHPKSVDPYHKNRKDSEGVFCPECLAQYEQGRWTWPKEGGKPREARVCSACRRIRDRFPAGEVLVTGTYLDSHREEIENLISNVVRDENSRSPLKRVIDFTSEQGRLMVSLTDDHLARRIGEALYKAYRGELAVKYSGGEKFVRLYWHRDAR
jgi:NMD protein affecting ribosome stability and mRNA decay